MGPTTDPSVLPTHRFSDQAVSVVVRIPGCVILYMINQADSNIKVGDVVRLQSHPTKFMIANSIDGVFVECKWQNDAGQWIFRTFKADELVVASEKDPVKK
jgi:uncharacterized protein YodC (DUF2158 family)